MRIVVRFFAIEPTFLLIDILLSFKTTIRLLLSFPELLSASYARPPVKAPSPITATTLPFSPLICLALARPTAAEIDVEL